MKQQANTLCNPPPSRAERRRERRALLSLALPLLGGQLAQAGYGFVDTVMAGQAGAAALAGVAVGGSIWMPLYLFMLGILMSTTAVVARLFAANKTSAANEVLQQALLLALLLSGIICLLLFRVEPLFRLLEVDPQIRPIVKDYLMGISLGAPAAAVFLVLRSYTESLGHTKPVLWISLAGLAANVPLNYIFIHGKLGLPALGGAGCGWATSISAWLMVALMAAYIKKSRHYRQQPLNLWPLQLRFDAFWRLLKLGFPSGLATFFEVSIFATIALFISTLGPVVTAGHQVALSITSLTFMVPLSLSMAATIRVGQARGKRDSGALRLSLQQAFRINMGIGCLLAILLVASHPWLPLIYSSDPAVCLLASQLLLWAAAYQLSDAWQVMTMGCLRGFEDTTWSMLITLLVYWGLALPCGYLLGLTDLIRPAMGPAGFWIGILVGLTAAAICLHWRLRLMEGKA